MQEQKQETDVHWRAKEGKGEFNYRLVYDFAVDPQVPVKRPCSFTMKAWDKDPTQFKSTLLGFYEVDLANLMDAAMKDALQHRERQQRVEALTKTGRIGEMEDCLRQFEKENREHRKNKLAKLAKETQKSKPKSSGFSKIMGSVRQGVVDKGCFTSFQKKADGLLDFGDTESDGDTGETPDELFGSAKYKSQNMREWELRTLKNEAAGTSSE